MGVAAAAGIGAVGAIGGGLLSASAAGQAGKQQSSAASNALNAQQGFFDTAQQGLSPFMNAGQSAQSQLQQLTGTNAGGNPLTAALTAQFNPSDLAATPGYQFSLNQGLKATQNQLASQGLGNSGQATAGAANYAEGLAGTTYNQQLQNYLAQNQQTYNMLQGQVGTGEQAAGALGGIATQTGQGIAQSNNQIGAAQAAGTLGSAAGLSNGLTGAASSAQQAALFSSLLGNNGTGLSGLSGDINSAGGQSLSSLGLVNSLAGF